MGPRFYRLNQCFLSRYYDVGTYGCEAERVYFDTEGRNVLLLKLARQMALDKGRLLRDIVSKWSLALSCEDCCLLVPEAPVACCCAPKNALNETYLASTTVTNKHELEGWDLALCGSFSHGCAVCCCGGV